MSALHADIGGLAPQKHCGHSLQALLASHLLAGEDLLARPTQVLLKARPASAMQTLASTPTDTQTIQI